MSSEAEAWFVSIRVGGGFTDPNTLGEVWDALEAIGARRAGSEVARDCRGRTLTKGTTLATISLACDGEREERFGPEDKPLSPSGLILAQAKANPTGGEPGLPGSSSGSAEVGTSTQASDGGPAGG